MFEEIAFSQDPQDIEKYSIDWTPGAKGRAAGICFPRSTEEVAKVLRICSEKGLSVVPSGGRTGLAMGAVAQNGEIVLSLEKMNTIGKLDPVALTVEVQAGAITESLHNRCAEAGLTWPVDLASKGSSQIGGNLSTNAGGTHVIRYGHSRHWVLGIVVVTMQGEILRLGGALEKNNAGWDMKQLFLGSEGILGVITEATLKLCPLPQEKTTLFCSVGNLQNALTLLQSVRMHPVISFEYMTQECLKAVQKFHQLPWPFKHNSTGYVLLEIEGSVHLELSAQEVLMAQSSAEEKNFWAWRENITESLSQLGNVYKHDVAVGVASLEAFTQELTDLAPKAYPGKSLYYFGHLGDGNLHLNIVDENKGDFSSFLESCKPGDSQLFHLIKKFNGSISAEHGIGLLKKDALKATLAPEQLKYLRALKRVFDPQGLLNPGKVI